MHLLFKILVHINVCNIFSLYFSYSLFLSGAYISASEPTPLDWYHLVFNYILTNATQGIVVYHDGQEVARSTNVVTGPTVASSGEVVIGRYYVPYDGAYSSVLVDEMLFFNRELNPGEILILYNMDK